LTDGVHRFVSSAAAVTVETKPTIAMMTKRMIELSCISRVVGSTSGAV
jgi:hypothetical protein